MCSFNMGLAIRLHTSDLFHLCIVSTADSNLSQDSLFSCLGMEFNGYLGEFSGWILQSRKFSSFGTGI